jgi:hypothetical protein
LKLPSFQFYPGDWMKDPELRSVSLAARGLWIDMLSLMFECDRRGYLQLNGKPVNADQLARMTGCSTGEVSHCLQELDDSGVFSRSDDGTIYSRRLVRDEKVRNQTADRVRRFRNGDVTQLVTQVKRSCTEDEDDIEVEITKPESLGKNPKTIKEVAVGFELKDAFNATEHAKMVAGELRISSWQVIEAIRLQLELETEKSGKPFEVITLQLIANGQDFNKSRKDLTYPWGWEKFFSEGHWRDRSSWPWKAGGNGKPVSAIAQLKKIKGE